MSRSRVTLATMDAAAIAALFVVAVDDRAVLGRDGPRRKPSTRHASAGGDSSHSTSRSPRRFERWRPGRSRRPGSRGPRRVPRPPAPRRRAARAAPAGTASSRSGTRAAGRGGRGASRSRAARRRRRAAPRASRVRPRPRPRRAARRASGRTGGAFGPSESSPAPRAEDTARPRTALCRVCDDFATSRGRCAERLRDDTELRVGVDPRLRQRRPEPRRERVRVVFAITACVDREYFGGWPRWPLRSPACSPTPTPPGSRSGSAPRRRGRRPSASSRR